MPDERCPTCGCPVDVRTTHEGTSYYRPQVDAELLAALRRAHKLLDEEHGHTDDTWGDRERWAEAQ